jgi:hypothetical protein
MNIYLPSGYVDMRKLLSLDLPFIVMVGARATGKTYGGLQYAIEDKIKFIYMRRTQTQVDVIMQPDFSPFKRLNEDFGWDIRPKKISKYTSGFYHSIEEEGAAVVQGAPLGYLCALSTMANMRGFDASDCDFYFYDEFMPEKHERPIKDEAAAFFNAHETINRNRELQGKKPIKTLIASNSNDLANPIFLELGLVRKASQMKQTGQTVYINKERGLCLVVMDENSPISQRKKDTALYRLTGTTSKFARMSLGNEFANDEIGRISSRPLAEYRPIVSYGELTIYQHKSKRTYYVSMHKTGSPPTYGTGDSERLRFRRQYLWIWEEYLDNNIEFEEYLCEIILTKIYS